MRKRKMLKQTEFEVGSNHYLLGCDKNGCRYWLKDPEFIEGEDGKPSQWEYPMMVEIVEDKWDSYYGSIGPFNIKEFNMIIVKTPLTEEELNKLFDYITTWFQLRITALLFEQGYSDITEKAKIDDIQNKYSAAYINDRLIPQVIERIRHLLSE